MRITRIGFALVAALVGASACQSKPRTGAEPAVSAIVVRNASVFEVNVYAVPSDDAAPVWLGTVPPKSTWHVPVTARGLQGEGMLVVRTQAIGSSRSWTSSPVAVSEWSYGLLDLSVSSTGDCSLSALRSLNAAEMSKM